jgi:hypothetical protein
MSRWISWVRPPRRPRVASRSIRWLLERGSMPYSPVTQPVPLLRRKGGTFSSTVAVQMSFVSPHSTRHEASENFMMPVVSLTLRNCEGWRPSGRNALMME